MSNRKAPPRYEVHSTADHSPTLSLNGGEKMHSLQGAFSESLYIYLPCIKECLNQPQPRILSMGLGLGYNECLALALLYKNNIDNFVITSFEKVDFLAQEFLNWIQSEKSCLQGCYQDILNRTSQHFEIQPKELFHYILQAYQQDKFIIHQELPTHNPSDTKYNGILYDAFSSETDNSLWTQDHLENFIDQYADKSQCHFATYAATGNLKRALKAKNFQLQKKDGFGVKRESTLATLLKTSNTVFY